MFSIIITIGRPSNIALLKLDKSQVIANYFLILDNISSLIILILSIIIIYQAIHKLNIVFDFSYLFLMLIAKLV